MCLSHTLSATTLGENAWNEKAGSLKFAFSLKLGFLCYVANKNGGNIKNQDGSRLEIVIVHRLGEVRHDEKASCCCIFIGHATSSESPVSGSLVESWDPMDGQTVDPVAFLLTLQSSLCLTITGFGWLHTYVTGVAEREAHRSIIDPAACNDQGRAWMGDGFGLVPYHTISYRYRRCFWVALLPS